MIAARPREAVGVTFAIAGLFLASWLARVPDIRDSFGLSNQRMGVVLFALAAGAVLGLPLSGYLVRRLGPAQAVRGFAVAAALGLALVGLAEQLSVLILGLFVFGAGAGIWDVAMNVAGAQVERELGRSIMPRFHAAFSVGTILGAGLAAAASVRQVDPALHLGVLAIIGLLAVFWMVRGFPREYRRSAPSGTQHQAWREPRIWLLGLLVLAFSFAEGSANDWLALAIVDGFERKNHEGAAFFGLFVAAMTAGRLLGPVLLDRFGRVLVLRSCAGLAALGVALVASGHSLFVAGIGTACWGLGASLGFPVGMSAAADDPARAPARVSAVASIGYLAFLAGPAALGFLGQRFGILPSFSLVLALLLLAFMVGSAARPQQPVR